MHNRRRIAIADAFGRGLGGLPKRGAGICKIALRTRAFPLRGRSRAFRNRPSNLQKMPDMAVFPIGRKLLSLTVPDGGPCRRGQGSRLKLPFPGIPEPSRISPRCRGAGIPKGPNLLPRSLPQPGTGQNQERQAAVRQKHPPVCRRSAAGDPESPAISARVCDHWRHCGNALGPRSMIGRVPAFRPGELSTRQKDRRMK